MGMNRPKVERSFYRNGQLREEVSFLGQQLHGACRTWHSNGRLASGIADIPKYRKMGIRVGMGVDGEGSSDLPDPFENNLVFNTNPFLDDKEVF